MAAIATTAKGCSPIGECCEKAPLKKKEGKGRERGRAASKNVEDALPVFLCVCLFNSDNGDNRPEFCRFCVASGTESENIAGGGAMGMDSWIARGISRRLFLPQRQAGMGWGKRGIGGNEDARDRPEVHFGRSGGRDTATVQNCPLIWADHIG